MYPEFRILRGKRILVTRPAHQAAREIEALRAAGAIPIHIPLIEIAPPLDNYATLDAAIAKIDSYSWIIFTSANAVDAFFSRMIKKDFPKAINIASVGPSTWERVENFGFCVALVPERHDSHGLLEHLAPKLKMNDRILWPRSRNSGEELSNGISKMGFLIDAIVAYQTLKPRELDLQLNSLLPEYHDLDAILFASPSAVNNFKSALQGNAETSSLKKIKMYGIGPTTDAALASNFPASR